jgi:uncharacterized protein (DUF983 family)
LAQDKFPGGSFRRRVSPFAAGFSCRCPRCGKGRLFKGYLTLLPRCPACDLDYSKADSGDGPAVFLIFIIGFLVVPLALWVHATFEPPRWLNLTLWPAVIVALSVLLLRPAKALLIALQFRHRASDSGLVRYDDD